MSSTAQMTDSAKIEAMAKMLESLSTDQKAELLQDIQSLNLAEEPQDSSRSGPDPSSNEAQNDGLPISSRHTLRLVDVSGGITVKDRSFKNAKFGKKVTGESNVCNNVGRTDGMAYVIQENNDFQNAVFEDGSSFLSNSYNGCVGFNPPPSEFLMPYFQPWGPTGDMGDMTQLPSTMNVMNTTEIQIVSFTDIIKRLLKRRRRS